ncbi:deoxyribose-phosphate aldolase [Tichowtungia aerotolerans]|uniref:Deoxyribose-phosphate aldolase n=1 Tax=Tichowtungia aerotolerans TaxID=2697043 RepID=A0A6P1M3U5_9BACT|nr:deoxyribose-phosphate aldolase [Tichowtungia aerotolerans]QHI69519.1 deoxyribose-phosphate aldolase [Tichowtungia aerotolerans]
MSRPICRTFDAAVLVPEMSREEAGNAIKTCVAIHAYSACVRPCDIELAQQICAGSNTKVCVVLGFPHGVQLSASKVDEAKRYVEMGVHEIDMVANYGWVRSGMWDEVRADIAAVSAVTKSAGTPLKVIFETSCLNADKIRKLTEVCIEAGADFVKTSTGFNGAGAQEEDVKLMLEIADGRIKVKASGGIRDAERAQMFIDMGVHRLGVNWSSSAAICAGGQAEGSGY